jgi:hypothetical protein
MKRILGILAVVALVAMTVQAVEVKSENVAGVYSVNIPADGKFVCLAVQLDPFDQADATLEGVLGTDQLREDAKGSPGDKVYIWDPGQGVGGGYDIYKLSDQGSGPVWYHIGSSTVSNPPVEAGDAMWIKSPVGNLDDLEITVTGQAVESTTVTTPVVEGFQLMGYPFSSQIAVQDTDFIADGAQKDAKGAPGDKLYLWDPVDGSYKILIVKDPDNHWSEVGGDGSAVSDVIGIGDGFWYKGGAGSGGFSWSETNKYLGNL